MIVLLMQFIWKYIDDLAGKGLSWFVMGELLLYTSATLVPLALPLAVLLSSIMTFGSLAENLELVAVRSAGIPLLRVMRPVFYISVILSILAFYFSDQLMPLANLKMRALIMDIQDQKPAMDIKPGIFYSDLKNVTIRAERVSADKKWIYGVMIYDFSEENNGNSRVTLAQSATVEVTPNKRYLILTLFSGKTYSEEKFFLNRDLSFPHVSASFDRQEIKVDISEFQLQRQSESLYRGHYTMLSLKALEKSIKELQWEEKARLKNIFSIMQRPMRAHAMTLNPETGALSHDPASSVSSPPNIRLNIKNFSDNNWWDGIPENGKTFLNIKASIWLSHNKNRLNELKNEHRYRIEHIARYRVEWHRKFTLSVACILMFLIGAPLGAIIRKGGLGLPLVSSVLIFIIYYIMSTFGEKAVKQLTLSHFVGMWLSTMVLLPFGLWLILKANDDSRIFRLETYTTLLRKVKIKSF